MINIKEAYGKLYDSLIGTRWENGLCVGRKDAKYTLDFSM